MSKKILLVTSKFPWPISGASEADRAYGIEQLKRLGYDIRVITKVTKDKVETVEPIARTLGIKICPVPYRNMSAFKKYKSMLLSRQFVPDSAAYEYYEPWIKEVFTKQYECFKPDIVWLDMTFMWPLAEFIDRKSTKIIIRSQNNEALHFLEEEGMSPINYLFYVIKLYTEKQVAKIADIIFAITPEEKEFYKSLRAKNVYVLPLRGLPKILQKTKSISKNPPYHIYFPCSTFNVKHNKRALLMILRDIAPEVQRRALGVFRFHIFGKKFPKEYTRYLNIHVSHDGTIDDIDADMMDIALVPSLSGRGMQQKIFEPLTRGIPTITSKRGLNGYPFEDGKELLLAETVNDYVNALLRLRDSILRETLSKNAMKLSGKLFSKERLDLAVTTALS